jgi:hypothetical protein
VSELEDFCGPVIASCCYEELVVEATNSSGNHEGKRLPLEAAAKTTAFEDVTVASGVCVRACVTINPITDPNPLYSHSNTR